MPLLWSHTAAGSATRSTFEKPDELTHHAGNKTATARALDISKVDLWKKMKRLGMM
jgi:DNA-binding NtrC family response regulator